MNNNLLITCIDETDTKNPGQWVSDKVNYDLIFLCYSNDQKFQDYLRTFRQPVLESHSGKWKNLKWFFDNFEFEQYDYFWFPDPDLEMDVDSVNRFFEYVNGKEFDLCQPSLTHNSICSHTFLKQDKSQEYRKVDFVEVMCPCFSKKALKELLWTFDLSYSGYGLDILWAKYFDCHVIDRFTVRHSRPQQFAIRAKKRGFPEPEEELRMIAKKYNLDIDKYGNWS